MVFLAGKVIVSVFDRQTKSRVAVIALTYTGIDGTAQSVPREWNAVHHDVRGGHLLATSGSGHLFWTPRYSDALQGSMKGAFLFTDYRMTALSVENGRAAFVVSVSLFSPLHFITHTR
jgi:hypothetical protein